MAIDLQALRKASEGDQDKKVTVSKAWLREVYIELTTKGQEPKSDFRAMVNDIMKNVRS